MMAYDVDTCIFFLNLTRELPEFYFQMANLLNQHGVTLIPVNLIELQEIKKGERNVMVLVHTASMQELSRFYRLRSRFIDHAVLHGKFRLFHTTSFGRIAKYARAMKNGYYHHFALPLRTSKLAESMANFAFKYHRNKERWPGGRRAKLPVAL